MKTITAIEVQRGNQQRVNVHMEGHFAFGLDALVAAEENLAVGQSLTEEDISRLTHEDELQRGYDAALGFIGYRPRSEAEVRQRLRQRGFDENVADATISKLRDRQFLDDAAFARFWLENRQSFSPRGERLLRIELRQKGVETETIDQVTDSLDDAEAAYRAAQKKLRSMVDADYQTFRQRVGAFLQRRGFGYETVSGVVARLWQERQGSNQQ